jgi:hypothetical protein
VFGVTLFGLKGGLVLLNGLEIGLGFLQGLVVVQLMLYAGQRLRGLLDVEVKFLQFIESSS